mmetsp:Transcript_2371/g.5427  ORF Transcript_2371/g.5427 Transcript_2371/m.5427 type:complete len:202 (+) Transcript_2371:96-701(+)
MLRNALIVFLLPLSVAAFVSQQQACRTSSSSSSPLLLFGMNKLGNGLEWKDVAVGDGDQVGSGDVVSVHYEGRRNGKVFENSRSAKVNRGMAGAIDGQPLSFPIGKGKVIQGWEVGILGQGTSMPGMKVGGKRSLRIPASLAYGPEGRGEIPGGATLDFEVELTGIDSKESLFKKAFMYSVPGIFGFLILNSLYLVLTGQS